MFQYDILYNILRFLDNEPHILSELMLVNSHTRNIILEDPYKLLWSWLTRGVKYPTKEPVNWIKAANVFSNSNIGTHCMYYPGCPCTMESVDWFGDDEECYMIRDEQNVIYKIKDNTIFRCQTLTIEEHQDHTEYPVDLILNIVSNEFMEGIYNEPMEVDYCNKGYIYNSVIVTRLKQGLIHCISYQLSNNIIRLEDIEYAIKNHPVLPISVLEYCKKSIGINWEELPIYLSKILNNVKDEEHLDYILSHAKNVIFIGDITCHYRYLCNVSQYANILRRYGITYNLISQLVGLHRSSDIMNDLDFMELYIENRHDECQWMIDNVISSEFNKYHCEYILDMDLYGEAKNIITELLTREDIVDYCYSLSYRNEFYYLKWIAMYNILQSYINRLEEGDRMKLLDRILQSNTNEQSIKRFLDYMHSCYSN